MRYYFHPDKENWKKQAYMMEDKDHNTVYDSRLEKLSLLKASTFSFSNRLTGKTEQHQIGGVVEIGTGTMHENISHIIEKYFKYDGERIWDYFIAKGYTIDSYLEGLKVMHSIYRSGAKIAHIESAGTDLFNDDERETGGIGGKLGFSGRYRVDCEPEDIDMIYLICFSLARTDQ